MVTMPKKYTEKFLLDDEVIVDGLRRCALMHAIDSIDMDDTENTKQIITVRTKLEMVYRQGTHQELQDALSETENILDKHNIPYSYLLRNIKPKKLQIKSISNG